MTREETQKILMAVQAAYPNFRAPDKTIAVNVWAEALGDLPFATVSKAVTTFAMTDTKGFAPSIGQIRALVFDASPVKILNDGEAWNMVYNALCNSNYHANEEFNRLPEDVRRAVGGAETLRS